MASGDHPGAETAWRRTLAISPRYDSAAINLVDFLLQENRVDEAARLLDETRRAGVENPILDYLEGRIALRRGDAVAARAALERALAGPLPPNVAADARRRLQSARSGRSSPGR